MIDQKHEIEYIKNNLSNFDYVKDAATSLGIISETCILNSADDLNTEISKNVEQAKQLLNDDSNLN